MSRIKTLYNEKYFTRKRVVTRAEAKSILETASQIFAVEQGEIEIPSLNGQRRLVAVLRFEQIVRAPKDVTDDEANPVALAR